MYGNRTQDVEFNHNTYQIITKIGDGGNARVYKAKKNNQEEVAISIQSQFYEEDVNNFKEISGVKWRYCAVPKAVFRQDRKHLYLELPLYDGDISKRTFTEKQLETLITQITQAIQDIHKDNYIHCDIKPLNILYKGDDYALCDFGSLIKLDSGKAFLGTVYYSPPETENGNADQSADIWAFGVSLFEIVQHDYFFCQANSDEINKKKTDQNYIDNRILKIQNLKLRYLIQEMVKINPKQRINATEILQALKENYNGKAILQSCRIQGIQLADGISFNKFVKSQQYLIPNCFQFNINYQTQEINEPIRKISFFRTNSVKQ